MLKFFKKRKLKKKLIFETHPYLQFDALIIPEDGLDFEVDADRRHEGRREWVVGVAEQEGGFAHRRVADDQQLEHVVKVLIGGVLLPSLVLRHCHLFGRVSGIKYKSLSSFLANFHALKKTETLLRIELKKSRWLKVWTCSRSSDRRRPFAIFGTASLPSGKGFLDVLFMLEMH